MKVLLILIFSATTILTFGQFSPKEKEIMAIVKGQDSISRAIFLDTATIKNMRLSSTVNWRQIWTDIDDNIKSIHQFYDIRIQFKTNAEALAFHNTYMAENSENGPEIKKHKIKINGTNELHVYTQNEKLSKIFLDPYGFQALCFIFVSNNYFVKFYVTCLKEYKPVYFKPFIEDAVKKTAKTN